MKSESTALQPGLQRFRNGARYKDSINRIEECDEPGFSQSGERLEV